VPKYAQAEIDRAAALITIEHYMRDIRPEGALLTSLCPFEDHGSRKRKFRYNPALGWWKCMVCNRAGNTPFKFYGYLKKYPVDTDGGFRGCWRQIMEDLIGPPGDVGATRVFTFAKPAPRPAPAHAVKTYRLPPAEDLDVIAAAQEVWRENLVAAPDVRRFLARRGVSARTAEREGLGYSVGNLAQRLQERAGAGTLRVADALTRAQRLGYLYRDGREAFEGRAILPTWRTVDGRRRPVYVVGRLIEDAPADDDAPKYLNQRLGEDGAQPLDGLEECLGRPLVFLVEGRFDRLVAIEYGYEALPAGGNVIPEALLVDVRRVGRRAALVFVADQDRPGRRGILTSIYRLDLPATARVGTMTLPAGLGVKDVGDLGRRGAEGRAIFDAALLASRRVDHRRIRRLCAAAARAVAAARRARFERERLPRRDTPREDTPFKKERLA